MTNLLTGGGGEIKTPLTDLKEKFNPDTDADKYLQSSDVHPPLPGEERISDWERYDPDEEAYPIKGNGIPHPPIIQYESMVIEDSGPEIAYDPDSEAEVLKNPLEQLNETYPDGLSSNETYDVNGHIIQTDDNSKVYSLDGELLPDSEYTLNGIKYKTDENGNKISWEGTLSSYTPDAERDEYAQVESGGKDRLPGDDGGHLEARVLGGDPGNGNLEPMRDTINRGDYKKSENEIVDAINNGNEVHDKGTIIREDPATTRPTKIEREYEYGDTKKVLVVDNVEGSTDLLESLEGNIDDIDYQNLKDEIKEIQNDGDIVSITSTCTELNSDGMINKITVGIRDETTGDKWYQTYIPTNNV